MIFSPTKCALVFGGGRSGDCWKVIAGVVVVVVVVVLVVVVVVEVVVRRCRCCCYRNFDWLVTDEQFRDEFARSENWLMSFFLFPV